MTEKKARAQEYDRLAKHYDQRLGLYARQTIEEAIQTAQLTGTEAILDTCCGTGELLQQVALAGHRGPLVGIDFSQTMLNVARRRLATYPHVVLKSSEVELLKFPNDYFHIAFNTNAFRYLVHPHQALEEIYRVLRPHGRLVLVDLTASSHLTQIWSFLRSRIRPSYQRIYHVDELAAMLRAAGFVISRHRRWRINLFWSVTLFEARKPAPAVHGA